MGSRQAARLALTIAGMLAGSQAKEQEDRIAAQKREREGIESKANVNLTEAQTALTRQKVSEIQGQRGVQLMQSLLPRVTSGIMAPAMGAAAGPAGLGAGMALQRGAAQPMTRQLTAKEKAEQIDLEFKAQDLKNKLKISENEVRLSEIKLQEQERKLREPEAAKEKTPEESKAVPDNVFRVLRGIVVSRLTPGEIASAARQIASGSGRPTDFALLEQHLIDNREEIAWNAQMTPQQVEEIVQWLAGKSAGNVSLSSPASLPPSAQPGIQDTLGILE